MQFNDPFPKSYQKLLEDILNQLEAETGQLYQFTINKFGTANNENLVIGDFNSRPSRIEVYDMDPDYRGLQGIYNNKSEIENKILELRGDDLFEEMKDWTDHTSKVYKIGKCKQCHSYNEGVPNSFPNVNSLHGCCQNRSCLRRILSKWDDIHISQHNGNIYSASGSVSICNFKGKYRFVK